MIRFAVLALLALALALPTAGARPRRTVTRNHKTTWTTPQGPVTQERTTVRGPVGSINSINEVNAKRAARGLPAFVPDPMLTAAAQAAAQFRADNLIEGHTSNDFAFLPPGAIAHAAGCSAVGSEWGFLSCCQWETWRYAGAASVVGRDGRVYHHLFVR